MLSDEQILNLYKDTDFPGSWSGARTFQMFLKLNKNEYVTLHRIYKIGSVFKSLKKFCNTNKK